MNRHLAMILSIVLMSITACGGTPKGAAQKAESATNTTQPETVQEAPGKTVRYLES